MFLNALYTLTFRLLSKEPSWPTVPYPVTALALRSWMNTILPTSLRCMANVPSSPLFISTRIPILRPALYDRRKRALLRLVPGAWMIESIDRYPVTTRRRTGRALSVAHPGYSSMRSSRLRFPESANDLLGSGRIGEGTWYLRRYWYGTCLVRGLVRIGGHIHNYVVFPNNAGGLRDGKQISEQQVWL